MVQPLFWFVVIATLLVVGFWQRSKNSPRQHRVLIENEHRSAVALGNTQPLRSLRVGEETKVVAVSRACRAPERRRLMDLGILPGAAIEVAMPSPLNDPVAYRGRDTLIALRREQAQMILIERA